MRAAMILLAALALTACATTAPPPTPVAATASTGVTGFATIARWGSYEVELAPMYTHLAVLRHRAARALRGDTIDVATARQVQALADTARGLLDSARRGDAATPTPEQRVMVVEAVAIMDRIDKILGRKE